MTRGATPEEVRQLLAIANPSPLGKRPGELPFKWAREIDAAVSAVTEIVEGTLTAGSLAMAYGESNSGKSYLFTHLAFCICLGRSWLGQRVERGAVIYVAGEGAKSIELRLAAWRSKYGSVPERFGLIGTALNLLDPSVDVEALVELIKEKASDIGEAIQLIVIDTVARAMFAGNENDAQDMGAFVRGCDRIREETGAAVLVIHHSGKDALKGARGHSSLRAALDSEMEISEESGLHIVKITKQRDLGTNGLRLAARFIPIDLGINQWGNAITACIVEDAENAPAEPTKKRSVKLPPAAQNVLTALETALSGHGESMPMTSVLPGGKGVKIDRLRTVFNLATPVESTEDRKEMRTRENTRRMTFRRGLEVCQARAVIGVAGDWIWKC